MEASPSIRKKSKPLHSQAKEIVFNVKQYFIQAKLNNGPLLPLTQVAERTAKATKLSTKSVQQIGKEGNLRENFEEQFKSPKRTRAQDSPITNFDDFDMCVLRRTVHSFYERKDIPTVDSIMKEMIKNVSYKGSKESLRKVLHKYGFHFGKVNSRKFLLERNDVIAARTRFIRQMNKI